MTIEVQKDGFFYPYAVPVTDAYMSAVPKTTTALWLRGDESSITTVEDLRVSSWTDVLSGNGISFNQTTASRRPYKKLNAVNGKTSIFFNGQTSGFGKFLTDGINLGVALANLIHLFIVFKVPLSSVSSNTQRILANNSSTTTFAQNFGIRPWSSNTANKLGYFKTESNLMNSTNNVNADQWLIGEWQIKGNQPSSFIHINGQLESTVTLPAQGTSNSAAFTIGSSNTGTDVCEIEIAEIICMNQIMTDPIPVRNYLSLRYNIPLVYP